MMFSKLFKSFCFVLVASLFLVSCADDNSVILEEQEETLENGVEFIVDGRSIMYDAEAVYCNSNGKEYLSISNDPNLLGSISVEWNDLDVDDYLINMVDDPAELGVFNIGGVVFGEAFTGNPDLTQFTSMVGIEIEILSNDGTTVVGNMEGDFLIINAAGDIEALPYTINFNAEIVGTSDFCD